MSQERLRLLEHIIYQEFGSATGEVASILLTRGALKFGQLTALSNLPPSTIQTCLLVLSIHSLLWHSETDVNGRLVELYEMNEVNIERRLRGGFYVDMAREWDENAAFDCVVESLWRDGMQRRDTLTETAANVLLMRQESLPDGLKKGDKKGKGKAKVEDFASAKKVAAKMLRKAFADGFICIVTPGSQLSPSSLEIKWEDELLRKISGIPTSKQLSELKEKLADKKAAWAEEELDYSRGGDGEGSAKKHGRHIEGVDEWPEIPPNAFLRICTDRFHIRWRAKIMEQFCADQYNAAVAVIFGCVLRITDRYCDSLSAWSTKNVTRGEVQAQWEQLPADKRPKLSDVFGTDSRVKNFKPDDMRDSDLILEILYLLADSDSPGYSDRPTFLTQHGDGPGARWAVDYDALGGWMKKSLVEATIRTKLDDVALLCWRILADKGKLDEKHLGRLAFLAVKDAREAIGRLSNAELIEAQEVPRSADRQPSRTIYLWGVNFHRVVSNVLNHQYKALANLQAQKEFKLDTNKLIVEKRDRVDVRADPSLLNKYERELVDKLEREMEALTVAEMRIQAQVFVLSELDPWTR